MAFVVSVPIPIRVPTPRFQCRRLQMALKTFSKYYVEFQKVRYDGLPKHDIKIVVLPLQCTVLLLLF